MSTEKIRNFSIIAHIDHGKSTLADRLLEYTGTIEKRQMKEQVLDTMDLERERGITIKAQAIRIEYNGYILNLIDTPGHVDFSYEVSRSLAACEGAILIVDATQGIEAQTLANAYLAINNNLTIIPVINKIDLQNAEVDKALEELKNVFGFKKEEAILASAKEGIGIKEILDAVIERVPPPVGDENAPLQALIFDSHYDIYRGVVAYVRIVNGTFKTGSRIRMMGSDLDYEVLELGTLKIGLVKRDSLSAGEVGYFISGVRNVRDCRVGDTVTDKSRPAYKPLPGYKPIKPMVYCGIFPVNAGDFEHLQDSLEKLQLNDAALFYEKETSSALGFGFRCGFLGLLHLEIIQERLEREYDLDLIATAPNVIYKINFKNKEPIFIDNPADFPDPSIIDSIEEPYCKLTLFTPSQYVGPLMEITNDKRGQFKGMEYLDPTRVMLNYEIPLSELISEYHDQMKSSSRGYASLDYELTGYKVSDLVKMDIMLNAEPVDALSTIVHREKAYSKGKLLVEKLKEVIPRHQFQIPVQASIGSKIIARENIAAMRKDVLAKCYGGDITRKRKLLEKQKAGKKRMKRIGSVDVPQEAFMAVLRLGK
ncbi:elongation factor 4 [Candidatus Saganbacteria bacterium]|nr:elongation factor 4 [Candidatus Saganbacteria bacterium]